MINVERSRRVISLALPIIGGMLSQNILNLVDIFFVKSLGSAALAAAGIGGFANFVSVALILGVSTGVQATVARRKGEGVKDELAKPLNTGLLIALVAGFFIASALYLAIPHLYHYLNDDPEVITLGSSYLQVRMVGLTFIGLNFAFRGYWNGINLSKVYMSTLIIMHMINVVMNYMLIFGNWGAPALGLEGAAWGTNISLMCGTMIYIFMGFKLAARNGFLSTLPTWTELRHMINLSLPSGIQQLFFSAGLLAFYGIVGRIGTVELAAANILTNLMLVAILPSMGLGLAAASLVGQALGRKDPGDAMAWGWDVAKLGSILIVLLCMPMYFAPNLVLSPFSPDETVLATAISPLFIIALYMPFDAVGLVIMNALLGAGATKSVMRISMSLQWLIFLPCAYLSVEYGGVGFVGIWLMQALYRLMQAVFFITKWRAGAWASIKV